MKTDPIPLIVDGIPVHVVRKPIKHLHLGVYPPDGRVRVSAPLHVTDDAVRMAVIGRLAWIRKHQARFAAQARQSARRMVSGESHLFLGRRYRLQVLEHRDVRQSVVVRGSTLELHVQPGTTDARREAILYGWYRAILRELVPPLIARWEPVLGVRAADWGIKRMKTRWGSCNTRDRRVWVNLELIKKAPECLEYVVVHELVHLLERGHGARFKALMDRHLPRWREVRARLNAEPLAHADWEC
jgi:predicted metal-dependent hydrolase